MPNRAIFMQQVVTATRMGETDFSQNLRGRVWQKIFLYFQTLDQRDSTSWTKVVSLEFSFLPFHKTKHYSLAVHICIHRSWMLQNFKGLKWKSASFQDSDKLLPWTSGCQPRLTPHRLSRKGEGEIWTHMPFSETKLSSYSKKRNFLMKARLTSGWL